MLSLLVFISAVWLTSCAPREATPEGTALPARRQFFSLDTLVTITLYQADPSCDIEMALFGAEALCKDYEKLFSRTVSGSDIWNLNHAGGAPVEVSEETLFLIKNSIALSEKTGGKFDITIAPVIDLWDNAEALPEETTLKSALSSVSYKNIEFDEEHHTVALKNSASEIDLGAVAKGYIADRLKQYLKEQGVTSALLDLGGNVLALGSKEENSPFHIAVKMPFTDTQSFYADQTLSKDSIAATLAIKDRSVVTSGIYERYREIDGRLYHHILDPQTGYPVDNSLASVTIISGDSLSGDLLSTSCLLVGKEAAEALIEALPDTEAIFIDKDGTISATSGISTYLIQ
ncbi:MAG: FAD:protein FMN transferase [Lachnospiraceae bacterium]|nr:FAD:protein FMN transferase [Lachnospiraceae bacterium]